MCALKSEHELPFGTACLISHRPCYRSAEPRFYRCERCGFLAVTFQAENPLHSRLCCCGGQINELVAAPETGALRHEIEYVIFGGYEHNAIRITVDNNLHPMTKEHQIQWIYLYTFEGGQLKFLSPGQMPVATFAMADQDAYVYCGRDICRMGREPCQFQCKRGHIIYVFCSLHGLQELRI